MKKTKHRVIRNILIDMICAGIALVVFALFHHVLPREQQSVGIVIPNPYKTDTNNIHRLRRRQRQRPEPVRSEQSGQTEQSGPRRDERHERQGRQRPE